MRFPDCRCGIQFCSRRIPPSAVLLCLDVISHTKLVYLRLDDYSLYPGVDPELVRLTEDEFCGRADAILVTARALMQTAPL